MIFSSILHVQYTGKDHHVNYIFYTEKDHCVTAQHC